jgi:hypothetical protein
MDDVRNSSEYIKASSRCAGWSNLICSESLRDKSNAIRFCVFSASRERSEGAVSVKTHNRQPTTARSAISRQIIFVFRTSNLRGYAERHGLARQEIWRAWPWMRMQGTVIPPQSYGMGTKAGTQFPCLTGPKPNQVPLSK